MHPVDFGGDVGGARARPVRLPASLACARESDAETSVGKATLLDPTHLSLHRARR